jgi:hypothetical protein
VDLAILNCNMQWDYEDAENIRRALGGRRPDTVPCNSGYTYDEPSYASQRPLKSDRGNSSVAKA